MKVDMGMYALREQGWKTNGFAYEIVAEQGFAQSMHMAVEAPQLLTDHE